MTHDLLIGCWLLCLSLYCYLLGRGHARQGKPGALPRRRYVGLNPDFSLK